MILRKDLIARIEGVALKIMEQISIGRAPYMSYFSGRGVSRSGTREGNVYSECSVDSQRETASSDGTSIDFIEEQDANDGGAENSERTTVDFAVKSSRNKFVLMVTIIAEAHRLLLTNATRTRRSLYYDLKNETTGYLVPDQRYVDRALNDVANLLECAPWDLSEFAESYFIRRTNCRLLIYKLQIRYRSDIITKIMRNRS